MNGTRVGRRALWCHLPKPFFLVSPYASGTGEKKGSEMRLYMAFSGDNRRTGSFGRGAHSSWATTLIPFVLTILTATALYTVGMR